MGAQGNLLAALAPFEPTVRAAASDAEAARRYPAELVEALGGIGLYRALVPRCLGGLELHPIELLEVVEEVSRWDGSAGWLAMIGSGASFLTGYLAADLVREIFGEPNAFLCGNLGAPSARAEPVEGGFCISGRWPFVSGCEYATWLGGSAVLPSGEPRIFVFPRSQCEIVDTWTVTGLRATGSHDVTVSDVFVPHNRSFWWAVQASAQAVDLMWAAAGGSPIYVSSPLERCFRDIHVATQHAAVGTLSWESIGKGLFDTALAQTLI